MPPVRRRRMEWSSREGSSTSRRRSENFRGLGAKLDGIIEPFLHVLFVYKSSCACGAATNAVAKKPKNKVFPAAVIKAVPRASRADSITAAAYTAHRPIFHAKILLWRTRRPKQLSPSPRVPQRRRRRTSTDALR